MYCPVCGSAYGAPTVLAERTLPVAGKRFTYRLLLTARVARELAIEISEENGDSAIASVGSDIACALDAYERISRNHVSPCHLAAVVHDLMYDLCTKN